MTSPAPAQDRRNHADRRARSRSALLAAAAKILTRRGYADMVLHRVASEAGFTKGALYHHFANKEELALAVVEWVSKSWHDEVGFLLADETTDPVGTLIAVARGTAVYSRHDVAKALTRLRSEFAGTNHPIDNALNGVIVGYVENLARLITAGRAASAIPEGPSAALVAHAYIGALDGIVNHLAGQEPSDALFAERAIMGVLGLPPRPNGVDA